MSEKIYTLKRLLNVTQALFERRLLADSAIKEILYAKIFLNEKGEKIYIEPFPIGSFDETGQTLSEVGIGWALSHILNPFDPYYSENSRSQTKSREFPEQLGRSVSGGESSDEKPKDGRQLIRAYIPSETGFYTRHFPPLFRERLRRRDQVGFSFKKVLFFIFAAAILTLLFWQAFLLFREKSSARERVLIADGADDGSRLLGVDISRRQSPVSVRGSGVSFWGAPVGDLREVEHYLHDEGVALDRLSQLRALLAENHEAWIEDVDEHLFTFARHARLIETGIAASMRAGRYISESVRQLSQVLSTELTDLLVQNRVFIRQMLCQVQSDLENGSLHLESKAISPQLLGAEEGLYAFVKEFSESNNRIQPIVDMKTSRVIGIYDTRNKSVIPLFPETLSPVCFQRK